MSQLQGALTWLRRVADPELRDTLWKSVVITASEEDPRAAPDYIRQNMTTLSPYLLGPATRTLGESRPASPLRTVLMESRRPSPAPATHHIQVNGRPIVYIY